MKIGIATFYESENYGTVLQAYALQKFLIDNGHQVEIIKTARNVNGTVASNKIEREKEGLLDKFRIKINSIAVKSQAKKKSEAFVDFRKENVIESKETFDNDNLSFLSKYDLLISGGDQIWNPYHKVFSTKYMFEGVKGTKISFSSSFGTSNLDSEFLQRIKPALLDYKAVSVREPSAEKILNDLGVKATFVLDPVFLLSKEQWLEFAKTQKPKKPYCLVYSLVDYSSKDAKAIKRYAKANNLQIRILPQNRKNLNNNFIKEFSASPKEFLSLIYNAERIFTNSFHGTAFSIIFNKQFTILNPLFGGMEQKLVRITDLIEELDLENFGFMQIGNNVYEKANKRITELTEKSKNFLLNNVR